jgi:hypothetical protein
MSFDTDSISFRNDFNLFPDGLRYFWYATLRFVVRALVLKKRRTKVRTIAPILLLPSEWKEYY